MLDRLALRVEDGRLEFNNDCRFHKGSKKRHLRTGR
jgi:hypothetical protein